MSSKFRFDATEGRESSVCWEDESSDAIETGRRLQPGGERRSIWRRSSLLSGSWWCSVLGTGFHFTAVVFSVLLHHTSHVQCTSRWLDKHQGVWLSVFSFFPTLAKLLNGKTSHFMINCKGNSLKQQMSLWYDSV